MDNWIIHIRKKFPEHDIVNLLSARQVTVEELGTDQYVSMWYFQYRSFEIFQSLSEGKPGGCK